MYFLATVAAVSNLGVGSIDIIFGGGGGTKQLNMTMCLLSCTSNKKYNLNQ